MPKIDLSALPVRVGTAYPRRFHRVNGDTSLREVQDLDVGLTAFGATRTVLPPGAASSLRHYHTHSDELVIVISGELTMVTNAGDTLMRAGDIAVFPMGEPDAHTFVNRSAEPAVLIAVGNNSDDDQWFYPDVGMRGQNATGYVNDVTGEPLTD